MLIGNYIHFARIDKYDDHFEGYWPKNDYELLKKMTGFDIPQFTKISRYATAVSCWHSSEYESSAMWRLYAYHNKTKKPGIAIQTSYEKLEKVVREFYEKNKKDYCIGGVGNIKYIDHHQGSMINDDEILNTYYPFMMKDISYEFEKEVRALLISNIGLRIPDSGIKIPITPSLLIEKIIINPLATQDCFDKIKIKLKKYGLSSALEYSRLSRFKFYGNNYDIQNTDER